MGLITTQHPVKPATPAKSPPARKPSKGAPSKPKRSALEILRLENPAHALLCPPADYIDCREPVQHITPDLVDQEPALYSLTFTGKLTGFGANGNVVWTCPSDRVPDLNALTWPLIKSTKRTDIDLVDVAGRQICVGQFSPPKNWANHRPGDPVLALGRIKKFGPKLTLDIIKAAPGSAVGKIWAQYAGIPGQIAGDRIESLVKGCLDSEEAYLACSALIQGETGMADRDLMASCGSIPGRGFTSCIELLKALHRPDTVEEGRLALEYAKRITALGIQASALRHHLRHPHPKAPLPVGRSNVIRVMAELALTPTKGQQEVALQITERLAQPKPLNALLSGDVGTGKTLAFLPPAVAAHLAGARVAIITPRTLLADQIASELLKHFDRQGIAVERVATGSRIRNHNAILVSTHGLSTTARKSNYTPQFLICDEQHKFSAEAREALVAPYTHVLEVSATPVPRSLAASLYDGMEILNLRECPVQKTIHSEVHDMHNRREVLAGIKHTLTHGGIAAMVYPVVNSADEQSARSVTAAYESMSSAYPGQVVMLHGDMPDDEMSANLAMLKSGQRRLVVASTVLEIGIDIPSVNFMVVRDADRFSISQLHQLRGRLVRNGGTGVFMMVVEDLASTPESSLERLRCVADTLDGYKLAEVDLVQRGFGDLDGSAQSGSSSMIFRNIHLSAADLLARKLKAVGPTTSSRNYNQSQTPNVPRQERLIG